MSAANDGFGVPVVPTLAVESQIAAIGKASNKLRIIRNFPGEKETKIDDGRSLMLDNQIFPWLYSAYRSVKHPR